MEAIATGLIVLVSIVFVIWFVQDQNIKQAAREAERRQHEAEQDNIRNKLVNFCTNAFDQFEAMPTYLIETELLLDKAEMDFKDRAFAPFWDSIQNAVASLGKFDAGAKMIAYVSWEHAKLANHLESAPPRFPINLETVNAMSAANATADRFNAIIRIAQRDFQFATIYEQRKTNGILVAGFNNLAQAIDGLGDRITSSIDNLTRQVSEMSSSINQSVSNLTSSVEDFHNTTQREASNQADRHKKALAMLDNIQRRRVPYPRKLDDGAY